MDGERTSRARIKGPAAGHNPSNPYHAHHHEPEEGAHESLARASYFPIYPKTILNPVKAPGLSFEYSLNPYQGCEHGCIYCYARPTHQYWDAGAGIDFERKIFYKPEAAQLLEATFRRKNYRPGKVLMSGNTDCYQPIERKLQITRSLLEVFVRFRHPVSVLTKNALVQRDVDLLRELARDRLVAVTVSITSSDETLRRIMEPRTVSYARKLALIRRLRTEGIPVGFIIGPVIPGLNDHLVEGIVRDAAAAGAQWGHYTLLRLPEPLPRLFEEWLERHFPHRKTKVMNLLRMARGASLDGRGCGDDYIHGGGELAHHIGRLFEAALQKAGLRSTMPELNTRLFNRGRPSLFSFA